MNPKYAHVCDTVSELLDLICGPTYHLGHPDPCGECVTVDRSVLLAGIDDFVKKREARARAEGLVLKKPVPILSSPLTAEELVLLEELDREQNGWAPRVIETGGVLTKEIIDDASAAVEKLWGSK